MCFIRLGRHPFVVVTHCIAARHTVNLGGAGEAIWASAVDPGLVSYPSGRCRFCIVLFCPRVSERILRSQSRRWYGREMMLDSRIGVPVLRRLIRGPYLLVS